MSKPASLAHLVMKTYQVAEMRTFYCKLLDAHVTFEQLPMASFITYDEDHHRMGFAMIPGKPTKPDGKVPGLAHVAFNFGNIRKLLTKYGELRDAGILPVLSVHHGITISLYYSDPDRNNIEFYVDTRSSEDSIKFMSSEVFRQKPLGIDFDPDRMLERMQDGATDEELNHYDEGAEVDLPTMLKRQQDALNFG